MLLIFCSACAGPRTHSAPPADSGQTRKTIYLASHGWHAGIVVRRSDIPNGVWPEHRDFADAEYLEVGWGDSDYYQTPDPHWGVALKAALLPTSSVLHVVGFRGAVTSYFPHSDIIEIRLTESGFEHLCRFIASSYSRDRTGSTVSIGPGLYGDSRFYRAGETYHLFNNCNAWSGRALKSAGCPIDPPTVITVKDLMAAARSCGSVIQSP
jgi:uncharacterized protein (TIGR02117 family)